MKSVKIDLTITIDEDTGNRIKIAIGGGDLKDARKWIVFMENQILADNSINLPIVDGSK